jgi:hypothetical protein
MDYTIDDYKNVCFAAAELSMAVEALQEAQHHLNNDFGWYDFGKCLDAVFKANEHYNKVNNDCVIEAIERSRKDKNNN